MIDKIRREFEEVFGPPPHNCSWVGSGYCSHSYNNWRANEYIDMFKGWKAAERNRKNLSESVIKEKARLHLQEGRSWRGDWEEGFETLVQICENFYVQGFKDGEKI